ncbi:hypothetical protein [Neisseria shayeganii]|nr:hypothetical protein [Neisseria shayeganii]
MKLNELSTLSADKFELTYTFNPTHPITRAKLDFEVEIRSTQSHVMRAFQESLIHRLQKENQTEKRTGKLKLFNRAELEADDVAECVALLVGIHGLLDDDDKPVQESKYEQILSDLPWLRTQIKEAAADDEHFLAL